MVGSIVTVSIVNLSCVCAVFPATSVATTLMVYMPSGSIFGVTLQLPSAPTVIVCFKTSRPDLSSTMVITSFALGSAVPSNLGFCLFVRLSLLEFPVSDAGSILTLTLVVVSMVKGSLVSEVFPAISLKTTTASYTPSFNATGT